MDEGNGDWFDDVRTSEDVHPPAMRRARQRAAAAIESSDLAALRRVLAAIPTSFTNLIINESLLNRAAELGRPGAVAALLEAGVPPDLISESGGTPLMAAAWGGHLEAAHHLLDAGADPDILVEDHCHDGDPDVVGRCALFFALAGGHRELIDLLEPVTRPDVRALAYRELPAYLEWRERNPPPHLPTVDLYRTISWGRPDLLREAIAAGGDVNHLMPREACPPLRGGTPLSWAAATGRMDLVDPLLEAGADPGRVGHDGRTPADFAELHGHHEVAERLRTCR